MLTTTPTHPPREYVRAVVPAESKSPHKYLIAHLTSSWPPPTFSTKPNPKPTPLHALPPSYLLHPTLPTHNDQIYLCIFEEEASTSIIRRSTNHQYQDCDAHAEASYGGLHRDAGSG